MSSALSDKYHKRKIFLVLAAGTAVPLTLLLQYLSSIVLLGMCGFMFGCFLVIEEAGMTPKLVHARRAKMMLALVNTTGRLDARGMNLLQRCRTLPTVWIPPGRRLQRRVQQEGPQRA